MYKNLPRSAKVFIGIFGLLILLFILFSASVAFLDFPLSVSQVNTYLTGGGDSNTPLLNNKDKASSPFANAKDKDIQERIKEKITDSFMEKVSVKSEIPGYTVKLTREGEKALASYLLAKDFFEDGRIAKTSASGRPILQAEAPEFVTAQTLTIVLSDEVDTSMIRSGTETEMGLDYIATDPNVQVVINAKPEDLELNAAEVEKVFGALIYQGIHFATYVYNLDGRTPEEYSPTPPEFYSVLRSGVSLVEINGRTSFNILNILSSLGLIGRVHAYCSGGRYCPVSFEQPCPAGSWWSYTHEACLKHYGCIWDSTLYGCIDTAPLCGSVWGGSECYWVNPPPDETCNYEGEACNQNDDCCDPLICDGSSGTCQMPDTEECFCDWRCGDSCTISGCVNQDLPREPDSWCTLYDEYGNPYGHIYRCAPTWGCDDPPSCEYTNPPTCGNLYVRNSGTSDSVTCISGLVDIVVTDVLNAESAVVQASLGGTSKNYAMSNAGGGTWRKTNVNLSSDLGGFGDVTLKFFPTNCDGQNIGCSPKIIQVVVKPDCPSTLSVEPICGATQSEATFSWEGNLSSPPSLWVLRVNRDDVSPFYPNSGYDDNEWMTDYDYWKYVPRDADHPNRIPSVCGTDGSGLYSCWARLDETTLGYGGFPFEPGHYNWWSIQAVDECGDYSSQCSVQGSGFDCVNTAPSCVFSTGPDTVYAGQTYNYTAIVDDTVDNINYVWSATGSTAANFTNLSPVSPVAPGTKISMDWTVPAASGGSTIPLTLTVDDTLLQSSCVKNVTVQNPQISGYLYDSSGGCLETPPTSPSLSELKDTSGVIVSSDTSSSNLLTLDSLDMYSTRDFAYGSTIESVCVSPSTISDAFNIGTEDTTYVTDTACPSGGLGADSLGCMTGAVSLTSDLQVDMPFKKISTLDGWFTAQDGLVYSGSGLQESTSVEALNGTHPYDGYMTNDFALSSGTLNITNADGDDTISSSGYVYDTGNPIDLSIVSAADSMPAGSFTEITDASGFANLDPDTLYKISATDMNSVISTNATYSAKFASAGVVVVYVEDDSSGPLVFDTAFTSGSSTHKLLIVSEPQVQITYDIGAVAPLGDGSDAQLEFGLISLSDITFTSDPDNPDTTLVFKGPLISEANIYMQRDRELDNRHPALAVHYDPVYFCTLQKRLLNSPGWIEDLLGLVSVSWSSGE